jgi:hypothetical protein
MYEERNAFAVQQLALERASDIVDVASKHPGDQEKA